MSNELVDVVFEEMGTDQGVSLNQILSGRTPFPTYILKQGENMPKSVLNALREGESALILDEHGEVYSMIVWDNLVGMREMSVTTMREYNQRKRVNDDRA